MAREREGIIFSYIDSPEGGGDEHGDVDSLEFTDEGCNVEEQIIQKLLLEKLNKVLKSFPASDRDFLLHSFGSDFGYLAAYAREHGMTKMQVTRKKEKLLDELREKFFEKECRTEKNPPGIDRTDR